MKICAVCSERLASNLCRRCGRPICSRCHFHHGLCKLCARDLGRIR